MVCMSDNTPQSPTEPLDRMEELAKLQERRQQRLTQLRQLRQGKPVLWTTDLSVNDAKLNPPLSSSPKLRKKKSTRATLSKSLPPTVVAPPPPFVSQKLLKKTSSASGRVEGRGRTSVSGEPSKREESPHPSSFLSRKKSVDAPADNIDLSKRPTSKTRRCSAQVPDRKPSNSRVGGSNRRSTSASADRLCKAAPHPTGSGDAACQKKPSSEKKAELDKVITQVKGSTASETERERSIWKIPSSEKKPELDEVITQVKNSTASGTEMERSNVASAEKMNVKNTSDTRTQSQSRLINKVPSTQNLPPLKIFDAGSVCSDIDYSQSAEELRQLIEAMQAEFQTLRDAKAQAEATANKLRTDFTLQQEETEAQLISLSSENERLKSTEIKLQVELKQGNEKLNKAEKEKCALRSRLLKTQNEKIVAETKATMLEVENAALQKALSDLGKTRGYGNVVMPEGFEECIEISDYAQSA